MIDTINITSTYGKGCKSGGHGFASLIDEGSIG